jgi:hypothetical protein
MVNIRRPCGVVVSARWSASDLKPAPAFPTASRTAFLRSNHQVKRKVELHLPHSASCLKHHHTPRKGANMPRFYFHLSAPDQDFPDNIGSNVSDLTGAVTGVGYRTVAILRLMQ